MASPPVIQDADTQSGTSTGTTSFNVTYPTNLVAGDLILVLCAAGGVVTPTATGFTALLNDSSNFLMGRISDGTETGTISFSIGGTARNIQWRALRINNWYGGTLSAGTTSNSSTGIEAVTSTQTNTTTPDPPAVTPAWGSADDLIIATVTGGASGTTVSSYPSSYTNGVVDNTNTLLASARRNVTGTTENPGTFTLGSATNATTGRTSTIALRPATQVSASETGSGADAIALDITTAISGLDDTGAGADAFSASVQSAVALTGETGAGVDSLAVAAMTDLSPGKLWIGRFVNTDPTYTISDEILNHEQVDEGQQRANVISVDGQEDSWTEYDRGDLVTRDLPINVYFDLPELKGVGDVRQRTVEELDGVKRNNSPGGECVWRPEFTRLDHIFWISEDGSKYETRIEGISVDFDQSSQPFQRATIDTGLMVFCPPDVADSYLVRDLFERTTSDGIGTADIGGAWTTS